MAPIRTPPDAERAPAEHVAPAGGTTPPGSSDAAKIAVVDSLLATGYQPDELRRHFGEAVDRSEFAATWTPNGTMQPPARRNLQREVDKWFIAKGVPHFGSNPSQGLIGFAFPLLAVVLGFELIAMPWLDLRQVTVRLRDLGLGGDPNGTGLLALALATVIFALLAALVSVVPLCRFQLPGLRPHETWRSPLWQARLLLTGAGMVVIRLVPLAALVWWLGHDDAFTQLRRGDLLDVAVFLLLLFSATRFWRRGTTAGVAWSVPLIVCVATVLTLWWTRRGNELGLGDLVRPSLLVLPFLLWLLLLALVPHRWRTEDSWQRTDHRAVRVPLLLTLLAFEVAVVPYAWSTLALVNALLAVAVLVLPLVVLKLLLDKGVVAAQREDATTPGAPSRLLLAVLGAVFVLVPAGLAFGVKDRLTDANALETAATMAAMNLVAFLAILSGVSLGLHHVYEWVTREPFRATTLRSRGLERAGPIVIVFIFLFFFTAELWNLAARLDGWRFWALVTGTMAVAAWLVTRSAGQVVEEQGRFDDYNAARTCAAEVRVRAIDDLVATEVPDPVPEIKLSPWERANIMAILITKALLRLVLVGAVVTGVLYGVGWLAIDSGVLNAWQVKGGQSPSYLGIRVAAFLGAFAALYFVVEGSRDQALRVASFHDVDDSIRRRLAVRILFRNVCEKNGRSAASAP